MLLGIFQVIARAAGLSWVDTRVMRIQARIAQNKAFSLVGESLWSWCWKVFSDGPYIVVRTIGRHQVLVLA